MARLARAHSPLLQFESTAHPVGAQSRLRLTDVGRQVLDGEADHVALNGIDRWIGGVHLHGHDVPWRWNEGTETITAISRRSAAATVIEWG